VALRSHGRCVRRGGGSPSIAGDRIVKCSCVSKAALPAPGPISWTAGPAELNLAANGQAKRRSALLAPVRVTCGSVA
jgi:hypothetical protein